MTVHFCKSLKFVGKVYRVFDTNGVFSRLNGSIERCWGMRGVQCWNIEDRDTSYIVYFQDSMELGNGYSFSWIFSGDL